MIEPVANTILPRAALKFAVIVILAVLVLAAASLDVVAPEMASTHSDPSALIWTSLGAIVWLALAGWLMFAPACIGTTALLAMLPSERPQLWPSVGLAVWLTWFTGLAAGAAFLSHVVLQIPNLIPIAAVVAVAGTLHTWWTWHAVRPSSPGRFSWLLVAVDILLLISVAGLMSGRWGAAT